MHMTEAIATTAPWISDKVNSSAQPEATKPLLRSITSMPETVEREGSLISVKRVLLTLGAILVCVAGVMVSGGNIYDAGSDFAYWLGIIGGTMILLQFAYSIRKHFRWARVLGSMRFWLVMHVICGVGGPLIILFHSTFGTKSLNGQIAFYTMLIVSLSGVVGRYVYVRIHHGLSGRRSTLREIQSRLECEENNVRPVQALAPNVVDMLHAFHANSFAPVSPAGRALRFIAIGIQAASIRRRCRRALRQELKSIARLQGWRQEQMNHHWKLACREISGYTAAVQAAAQFSAWEKLFRLWHVAHIPLLFLLFLSSVAHIVAVHMY